MDLEKYKKNKPKQQYVLTTIYVTKEQKDFFKKNNLNLSEIIRDYLDKIIKESKK